MKSEVFCKNLPQTPQSSPICFRTFGKRLRVLGPKQLKTHSLEVWDILKPSWTRRRVRLSNSDELQYEHVAEVYIKLHNLDSQENADPSNYQKAPNKIIWEEPATLNLMPFANMDRKDDHFSINCPRGLLQSWLVERWRHLVNWSMHCSLVWMYQSHACQML